MDEQNNDSETQKNFKTLLDPVISETLARLHGISWLWQKWVYQSVQCKTGL